jgi:hypothetical protein
MNTFKDNSGREWKLSLTIGSAIKVKDNLQVDLLQPEVGDPPVLTKLGVDELLLAQVIAIMLEGQFELHNVDRDDIYETFDGPTLARAHEAFYKELIDFFQSRGRQDRATAVRKQMKMIQSGIVAATTKIDNINVDAVIDKEMSKITFGETSGDSPVDSESIQDH